MNKKKMFNILFLIWIIIFIVLLIMYNKNLLSDFDNNIYNFIIKFKSNYVTDLAMLLSFLCSTWFIAMACCFIMIVFKNRKIGFYTSFSVLACYVLNLFIKNVVMRPRPVGINLVNENGYSFPSGHSMGAVSFYGFLMYVVYKSDINIKIKRLIYLLFSLIIIFIGISRIYLGVHYASDVLAGFSISSAFLFLYINMIDFNKNKKRR